MIREIVLCDQDPDVLAAWREQFARTAAVEVREGNPLDVDEPALLVPGNSFGFLDRGLPLRVCERFGFEAQDLVQEAIRTQADGELLVGQALLVELDEGRRVIVYAPIWRSPQSIARTINVHLAVRAALRTASRGREDLARLVVPAMGVGDGQLDPRVSARQIRYAFEIHTGLRSAGTINLTQVERRERKLRAVPGT